MDDAEEEKVQLLESLRLQDAALSTTVDNTIVSLPSDSDSENDETPAKQTRPVDSGPSEGTSINNEDDDAESVEEVNRDPSWADALEANREYDEVLGQLEAEIRMNLAKVSKQLDEVHLKLTRVNDERVAMNLKSHWLYVFGMPYFKTHDFYPCPFNKDYTTKKNNNEICWTDLPVYHQWIPHYKKVLTGAIRRLSLDKCIKDAKLKLVVLRRDADAAKQAGNIERAEELEEQIKSFDIDAVAESSVEDVILNGDHDWLLISAKYLEGKHSPESCRNFWNLYLHPKINKAPYTPEEEKHLSTLAETYGQQNWDAIAEELGTNRSCYQCFIVYQNKLNANIRRAVWDPDEDQQLIKLVGKFRIGEYIPWAKVAYHLEGRTKRQVFNRWTYSLKPSIRKGRFTQEEDIMILVGVQMWGENYQRISHFLNDRTTCQIRDRYKHYLSRPGLGIPWTVQDDERLLKLEREHGKDWKKIAKFFPSKDRTQVRHRHTSLIRFMERNPDAPLTDAPSRCYNPQQYKDFQEQWDKAKVILNCQTIDDMVKAKNNLVSSLLKKTKKKLIPDPPKKKKHSVIESDLVNYFRCSYDIPGACRKLQLKSGEAHKYADELAIILSLLKANLNLPGFEELDQDETLSHSDREILKSYISRSTEIFKNSPPQTPEMMFSEPNTDTNSEKSVPLFCDEITPSGPPPDSLDCSSIDYVPSHDLASRYIELPLMNFENDEVVADRNKDPSFYEPPNFDYIVPERHPTPPPPKAECFMLPPNLTSIVGLRTFLLNRRTLLNTASPVVDVENSKLAEAKRKFDERIWCLFLWPALMSRHAPNSCDLTFEEVKEVKKKNSFLTGIRKPKPSQERTAALAATGQSVSQDNAKPSTSGTSKAKPKPKPKAALAATGQSVSQDNAKPSTSGTSKAKPKAKQPQISDAGPAKKRRKVSKTIEDEDPDDPDEIMEIID